MYDRHNPNRMLIPVLACCVAASVFIAMIATVAVQQDSPSVTQVGQSTTKPAPKTKQPTSNYSSPTTEKKPINNTETIQANAPPDFQPPTFTTPTTPRPLQSNSPKSTNDKPLFHPNPPNNAAKFLEEVSAGTFKGWRDGPVDDSSPDIGPIDPAYYQERLKQYLSKYENDPESVEIIEFTRVKQWGNHVEAGVTYRAKNSFGATQTKTIKFMFLDGMITNVPIPGR